MANAADFVRLALRLPDVVEYPHFDRRAFKARITFATLAADGASANQEFKCLLAPEAFAPIANAWGRKGWTIATLAALSEEELQAALEMAFAHARTKKRK
jgi:hypothetical protein